MAKRNPAPSVPSEPPKRPRGRPPSPDGRKSPAEVQRAYRARLAAAGKVVRLVDTAPPVDPDAPDIVWYQARVSTLNAELRKALDTAEYLKADRELFEARAYEAEARMQDAEWKEGLALNAKIVLQKEIDALKAKAKRGKR